MRKSRAPEFFDRVAKGSLSECWLWTGPVSVYGYGVYSKKLDNGQEIQRPAHREAFERSLFREKIPKDKVVRHSCDNKLCCNPNHLSIGTHADNVLDKVSRGRQNRGETSWNHVISENIVKEIRKLSSLGISQESIAKRFKICQPSVSKIINKKAWKHV